MPDNRDVGDNAEVPLVGGAQTQGIVRVGETVRRPRHARSEYVQALLRHLELVGYAGAPRPLGYDDLGREVLTFIEGDVPAGPPFGLSDAQLLSATDLIRDFHDAAASWAARGGGETVCHGDLGPHNTVFDGDVAVGLIDWDEDAAPGSRIVDFAHAVWCFADVTEATVPVSEQARKVALMCSAYPGMTPGGVVAEITARFHRAREQHAAAGRPRAVGVFDRLIAWMTAHGPALARTCATRASHPPGRPAGRLEAKGGLSRGPRLEKPPGSCISWSSPTSSASVTARRRTDPGREPPARSSE